MAQALTLTTAKQRKYPYPKPNRSIPLYEDPYLRDPIRLMASLTRFSFLASTGQIPFGNENFRNMLPILNRYCDSQSTAEDMILLLRIYNPPTHRQRHIYVPQLLCLKSSSILNAIGNLDQFGEAIFLDGTTTGEWIIFLVFVNPPRIEVFIVGDIEKEQVVSRTQRLRNCIEKVLPDKDIPCSYRVKFPSKIPVDNGSLTFVLVHYLYQHGNYLDLDADTIRLYKLSAISPLRSPNKNFLLCHDIWFGYVLPHPTTKPWHPFVVSVSNGNEEFKESLDKNGWVVIDVDGDGNCGFYCFILGLELFNNFLFSVNTENPPKSPMIKNKPWQYNVMKMRHHLAKASRELTSTEYPDGIYVQERDEENDWFQYTMASSDEEFFELGEWFICDELKQIDYFNRTLVKQNSEFTDYQMNPYWGSLVFSYRFNMRVIIYTRTTSYKQTTDDDGQDKPDARDDDGQDKSDVTHDKEEDKPTVTHDKEEDTPTIAHDKEKEDLQYSWSTHIIDHSCHFKERIQTEEGLNRMSDDEFKRKPTIELVYTNGYVAKNAKDDHHFQFLYRGYFITRDTQVLPAEDRETETQSKEPTSTTQQEVDVEPIMDVPHVQENISATNTEVEVESIRNDPQVQVNASVALPEVEVEPIKVRSPAEREWFRHPNKGQCPDA